MNKDEIFIDGIRKYICVGYSETEKPIYVLSPEYEKYIREEEKSTQTLPKADAYSLLGEVVNALIDTNEFLDELYGAHGDSGIIERIELNDEIINKYRGGFYENTLYYYKNKRL